MFQNAVRPVLQHAADPQLPGLGRFHRLCRLRPAPTQHSHVAAAAPSRRQTTSDPALATNPVPSCHQRGGAGARAGGDGPAGRARGAVRSSGQLQVNAGFNLAQKNWVP